MSAAYLRVVDALRANGQNIIERGESRASAQCPAHDDGSPSLSVTGIEGSVLLHCHAGCDTAAVIDAVGLTARDLFDDRQGAAYTYPDGRIVHRTHDKRFYQKGNTKGRSLFGADLIGEAALVYVAEGEKDVRAIRAAGGVAVCPAMGAGKAGKFDWSPLKGIDVVVVADNDGPGRKHAALVADQLDGIAATVRVVQAAEGKDAADHVAAGHSLLEFVDASADEPTAEAKPEPEPVQAVSLDEAHTVYRRWLGDHYDTDAIDVCLAAVAVERFDDGSDPIWVLVVSGAGAAKTETVTSVVGTGAKMASSISGESALLSATPARERAKNATGGLLRRMGERGVLIIKDVTSILSMNKDVRAKVLGALREVYDGHWDREVGAEGGRVLTWDGRIVVIGAVTTAWDTHHAVIASMGDRFVLVRIDSAKNRMASGRKAIGNTGDEKRMRKELSAAAAGVIAGMCTTPITLTDSETERLLESADIVTLSRTAVEYDYKGNVIDAHAPEANTRFPKQLTQIVRGAVAIGMDRADAMRLAIRVARDSMPPMRLAIVDDLSTYPGSTPTEVRKRLDKPRTTVDRQLQALHILGVVGLSEDETHQWNGAVKNTWRYSLADGIDPNVLSVPSPEKLLTDSCNQKRERRDEGRETNEGACTYFSGDGPPAETPPPPANGALFDDPSTDGDVRYCGCGNELLSPEALRSGRCKPCRDKEMAGYDR